MFALISRDGNQFQFHVSAVSTFKAMSLLWQLLSLAEIDALLSTIDSFVSEYHCVHGASGGFRVALESEDLQKVKDFMHCSLALGRAFDLELMSCQRLVDILIPPFLKLAQAHIAAAGKGVPAEHNWIRIVTHFENGLDACAESHPFWATLSGQSWGTSACDGAQETRWAPERNPWSQVSWGETNQRICKLQTRKPETCKAYTHYSELTLGPPWWQETLNPLTLTLKHYPPKP